MEIIHAYNFFLESLDKESWEILLPELKVKVKALKLLSEIYKENFNANLLKVIHGLVDLFSFMEDQLDQLHEQEIKDIKDEIKGYIVAMSLPHFQPIIKGMKWLTP